MTENKTSPAHKLLWQEFHSGFPDTGHTTFYYNGDNEISCSLCDHIVEVIFGTIDEEHTSEEYHYVQESWWADGDSEVLLVFRHGESKNWSEDEWKDHVIASAKERLKIEAIEQEDPQVRVELRRYKTVTYKRNEEVVWTHDVNSVQS